MSEMIEFSITLVTDDKKYKENADISIPEDEWLILKGFHEDSETLRSTKFVQNKRGGQISVTFKEGQPIFSSAKKFDMDEVWSMLLKLRPFILQDERNYFPKIKNILKRRVEHPGFRKHLDILNEAYTLKAMQDRLTVCAGGRQIISQDVVKDWLNSFEYHQDIEKRNLVEADLGIFGKDQKGAPIIIFSLVDMIQSILHLGDFVETLMQVQDGRLNEISCPAGYLSRS